MWGEHSGDSVENGLNFYDTGRETIEEFYEVKPCLRDKVQENLKRSRQNSQRYFIVNLYTVRLLVQSSLNIWVCVCAHTCTGHSSKKCIVCLHVSRNENTKKKTFTKSVISIP